MESTTLPAQSPTPGSRVAQYLALTKPRVTQLAVFCAVIGMFLATPGMVPWQILVGGTVGIGMLAGGAFAINCLVEQKIDALKYQKAAMSAEDYKTQLSSALVDLARVQQELEK